jgi:DNA polymerase-1
VGDTSDNVPGVAKCGPKTASKWLFQYQTLDNLVSHAHEIGGKIGESLRASIPQLALSKKLVTIKIDVELPQTIDKLTLQPADHHQLLTWAHELELKGWLKEWEQQDKKPTLTEQHIPSMTTLSINPVIVINSESTFADFAKQCAQALKLCIHVHLEQDRLMGIALAIDTHQPFYAPCDTKEALSLLQSKLKPLLEQTDCIKIGHDLKRDYTTLKHHGITLSCMAYDTMLESYLSNSTTKQHDLATLMQLHLPEQRTDDNVEHLKAVHILALHNILYPTLNERLQHVLRAIEMPLVSILGDMEFHGVLLNTHQLAEQGTRLHAQINTLEEEAHALANRTFNLNSPKQLLDILYHEQQLPVLAKTPTGSPSTAETVLQELALNYRLPAVILEYRSLTKLVSTYIEALPKHVAPHTHRVHTSYNQAITSTGRLSSSDPNLQNIPIKHHEGRLIRKAFIAPPKHRILTADYSQVELRIMAHLSKDSQLQDAFSKGLDIHTATASEIFSTPLESVTAEQRRRAKAVNFGLIYGMSAFGLAKQLGIERRDAQHYMTLYFERYPGVLHYMQQTREQAHEQGYVETLFGRRLLIPEINSRNKMRQQAAERMAINAPMQGSAADIIKYAMIAVSNWQHNGIDMIMQVHDELVFEVPEERVDEAKEGIRHCMEHAIKLDVPLIVSIGIGADWNEAH